MYSFKAGDEVVAVGAPEGLRPWQDRKDHNMKASEVYVVKAAISFGSWVGLVIEGHPSPSPHFSYAWDSICFRPVTRTRDTLSIESFMTIKTGQPEGPRRVVGPVSPKKERV